MAGRDSGFGISEYSPVGKTLTGPAVTFDRETVSKGLTAAPSVA